MEGKTENIMEGFKTIKDSTRPPANVCFIYSSLTVLLLYQWYSLVNDTDIEEDVGPLWVPKIKIAGKGIQKLDPNRTQACVFVPVTLTLIR